MEQFDNCSCNKAAVSMPKIPGQDSILYLKMFASVSPGNAGLRDKTLVTETSKKVIAGVYYPDEDAAELTPHEQGRPKPQPKRELLPVQYVPIEQLE